MKQNLTAAVSILKGTTVVAGDRKSGDAFAIPFTNRKHVDGGRVLRPSYGVSNSMQKSLIALASRVEYIGGMPNYIFEGR